MTTQKKEQVNLIDAWLEENEDKEIQALVKKNVSIANRVIDILKAKGMSRVDFATKMGKSPSEITKLLSGQHNINTKTIVKMELALEESIIEVPGKEPKKEYVYLTAYVNNHEKEDGFREALIEGCI
ncbi:helix-turn-helix transcriptional regulator [Elizabethkingia anophelis]|uniref:helix-turn-helix domain-containing protein n=1 Tax=Elizabethkingia anophelis TaxID=1117645 RepID=UPI0013662EF5|nr:helix-turn-helix transcriptional regulator [Elizabethkingia anophelis]MCT3946676.1 helix-turn-helix transcriptional regulator [Elizabethkingia anophelis]MCT3996290.1 helix-turn-helix transcriptional regulator [Elizabethkingia anophelis]MCT3999945.1 helix-turn-helix transcriptional regulator [Elizabethkingia anophelis]MCT4256504.1 helix-turn-helix transcriptional regulator [Elizabethkingia anophelis]MDV3876168.1 hypothetical protein [Elizabethkingia anophelis]